MKPPVEIVEAHTIEQFDEVRKLFRSYQAGLPPHLRFSDAEWQELPGAYSSPGGVLLFATVDGKSAGCVGLRPFPVNGTCEIKRLYVDPLYRGHNLGRSLMVRVLDIARSMGYTSVRLDTHAATMGAAVALYRQFGFEQIPADPMPQVEGLSYMELVLGSRSHV
jgi:carbonic anhydrase